MTLIWKHPKKLQKGGGTFEVGTIGQRKTGFLFSRIRTVFFMKTQPLNLIFIGGKQKQPSLSRCRVHVKNRSMLSCFQVTWCHSQFELNGRTNP